MYNIAIVDEHQLFREGLKSIVSTWMNDFTVVLECSNGQELLDSLLTLPVKDLPSVITLDISMPILDGYETMSILNTQFPSVKVLVVTMYEHENSVLKMLQKGAKGFLPKGSSKDELFHALHTVVHDGYFSLGFEPKNLIGKPVLNLTDAELCFLELSCTPMAYKEIASKMGITFRMANMYREVLFKKTHTTTRTALAIYALATGLLPFNSFKSLNPDR